jgi:hypothetical protein
MRRGEGCMRVNRPAMDNSAEGSSSEFSTCYHRSMRSVRVFEYVTS